MGNGIHASRLISLIILLVHRVIRVNEFIPGSRKLLSGLIPSHLSQIVVTTGNVDDRKPLAGSNLLSRIYGKLFGDKGYISQSLFEQLFIDGIHLITKLRKNMKNSLMHLSDKILMRKRALVETVIDELKNMCQIEHTHHRSQEGFIVNLISGLIAYSYLPKKPSVNLEIIDQSMALAS
jgi:hypothetical protein